MRPDPLHSKAILPDLASTQPVGRRGFLGLGAALIAGGLSLVFAAGFRTTRT